MSVSSIRTQAIRAYQLNQILRRHPEIVEARTAAAGIRDRFELSAAAQSRLAASAPTGVRRARSSAGFLSTVRRFARHMNVLVRRAWRGNRPTSRPGVAAQSAFDIRV